MHSKQNHLFRVLPFPDSSSFCLTSWHGAVPLPLHDVGIVATQCSCTWVLSTTLRARWKLACLTALRIVPCASVPEAILQRFVLAALLALLRLRRLALAFVTVPHDFRQIFRLWLRRCFRAAYSTTYTCAFITFPCGALGLVHCLLGLGDTAFHAKWTLAVAAGCMVVAGVLFVEGI